MAIARCEQCGRPTGGNVTPPGYADQRYLPADHPPSAVVCGTKGCENDAIIWLKLDEAQAYQQGQRIFEFMSNTAKVRVQ